jgi:zinc protease
MNVSRTLFWAGALAFVAAVPVVRTVALADKAPEPAKPAAAAAATPKIAYTHFVLDNGLRVFIVEDHATPSLAIVTHYKVGSKDEVAGRTGFAHLFEHMMFKGSAHTPDGMIDVLFENAGGSTNAFTSADVTVYTDISASNFLETALWLEADRIAGLTDTLDQAKLDNQREVVRNERRQSYENQPYGMWHPLTMEALWPKGHGYHWPTIGYHEDLIAASLGDVKKFFETYYVPNNATMVLVGDIDAAKAKELVTKYLGWIPRGAVPKRPTYKTPAPITKEIRLNSTDDVQIPKVFMAWRAPALWSPEEAPGELAAYVLSVGKTSRLYQKLVFEDRLCQDVGAFLDTGDLGSNFFIIATPKPGVDPEKVIAAITAELDKLAAAPPSAGELERVKATWEAGFLAGLEDIMSRGIRLAAYDVQAGDPDYLGKDLERHRNVTGPQISSFVKKYLGKSQRVVLVISPEKPKAGKAAGKEGK